MSQRTPREYHMSKFAVSKSFDISYVLCMLCLLLASAVMPDHLSLVFSMLIGFCIRDLTGFVSVYVPKTQKKQKRTLIKCRTIKGRRYRHRRVSHAACVGKCKVARFLLSMFCMVAVSYVAYTWQLPRCALNKLAHAMNGNGPPSASAKGRGKGNSKGKAKSYSGSPQAQPFQNVDGPQQLTEMYSIVKTNEEVKKDQDFKAKMRAALPSAAWTHTVPTLLEDEWSARTCLHNELGASGGIAYVRKDQVTDVVTRVGYTKSPCAIVTSQSAQELGMPYVSTPIRCNLSVRAADGSREITEVSKYLTQLGFGEKVSRTVTGPRVNAPCTMTKVTVKFDTATGLEPNDLSGKNVAAALIKHIEDGLFLDINVRSDLTATVMIQDSVLDQLMHGSGFDHVYFKVHINDPMADKYEVLWLSSDTSHDDALKLNRMENAQGLAMKRTAAGPRYGIRFLSLDAMDAFATKYKLGARHKMGRFRITGVPSAVGIKGVHDMLHPHGWTIEEVEYGGENSISFLCSQQGTVCKMHWQDHRGNLIPVHVKALNAAAKRMAASANQESQQEKSFNVSSSRAEVQKALFIKRNEPNKDKTHMTPPPKQARTEG